MRRESLIILVAVLGLILLLNGCAPFETARNVQKDSEYHQHISELTVVVSPLGNVRQRVVASREVVITSELKEKLAKEVGFAHRSVSDSAAAVLADKLTSYGISIASSSQARLVFTLYDAETTCFSGCQHKLWYQAALYDGRFSPLKKAWSGEFSYWFSGDQEDTRQMEKQIDNFSLQVVEQLKVSNLITTKNKGE